MVDVAWVVAGLVAILAIGLAGAAGLIWLLNRQRRCPSCGVPLAVISPNDADGPLGYEVLACPRCTNALTLVHGSRARYAYCPECHQRTLETPCIRLPDTPEGQRRVEVHEHCHLCGHMAVREVSDPPVEPAKRGQILPFRRRTKGG